MHVGGIKNHFFMKTADSRQPAAPMAAATVILTRQYDGELQVYLLKRSINSGFMAGNYVFPGGMVDAEDWDFKIWQPHVDLDLTGLSRHLGGGFTAAQALAYGVAAIRETLEEAGVFLARKRENNGAIPQQIFKLRLSGDLQQGWFLKAVASQGWVLKLSALMRWAHWITPVLMKRRYDTRFFLAVLPSGQRCQPDAKETTHGLWISPRAGLAGNLAGEIPLSPPTLITLHQLLKYSHLKDLENEAESRQWGQAFLPRLIPMDSGAVILQPWDPQYHQKEVGINSPDLAQRVLAPEASFSRIWYHKGIWRPVAC
jgi:8-oxo-dGTP pyrophosphatase MutT (NUDIX family)